MCLNAYLQKCTDLWRRNTGTRCVAVDVVDGFLEDHSLLSEALQVLGAFPRAVVVLANLHVWEQGSLSVNVA